MYRVTPRRTRHESSRPRLVGASKAAITGTYRVLDDFKKNEAAAGRMPARGGYVWFVDFQHSNRQS